MDEKEKEIVRVSAALTVEEADDFDAAIASLANELANEYPGATLTRSSVIVGLIKQFIARS